MKLLAISFVGLICSALGSVARAEFCAGPELVCETVTRVFPISSQVPLASAVLIGSNLLVTSRHAVADREDATVFLPGGERKKARVLPTSYLGDLILLKIQAPDYLKALDHSAEFSVSSEVYTVAADLGRKKKIRVYKAGKILSMPPPDKPLARIHHTAESFPGNSGGALVDSFGRLVGIVAAGGDGYFEAIPVTQIGSLIENSGRRHESISKSRGSAYRQCRKAIFQANNSSNAMKKKHIEFITNRCVATSNKQLLDLAGQALGTRRHFASAINFFDLAIQQDPLSINSRLGMVVTLHLAGRYKEEFPHLQYLLKIIPNNLQVLRFSIQAGTWGENMEFRKSGLKLLKRYFPKMVPLAEKITTSPPPVRKN